MGSTIMNMLNRMNDFISANIGGFISSGVIAFLGFFIKYIALPQFGMSGMLAMILTGLTNSILDSVIGAAFQAKYQIPNNNEILVKQLTERKNFNGTPLKLVKGLKWVNNDVVNFISVFICGLLLMILW